MKPAHLVSSLSKIVAFAHLEHGLLTVEQLDEWLETIKSASVESLAFPYNPFDRMTPTPASLPIRSGIEKLREYFNRLSDDQDKSVALRGFADQVAKIIRASRSIAECKAAAFLMTAPILPSNARPAYEELLKMLDARSTADVSARWDIFIPKSPVPAEEILVSLDAHETNAELRSQLELLRRKTTSIEIDVTSKECLESVLPRYGAQPLHLSSYDYGKLFSHLVEWCMSTDRDLPVPPSITFE